MAYEEKTQRTEQLSNLILEGRAKLSVSGVEYVDSFDEETVVISTTKGTLLVKGQELHLEKLSLDTGEIIVEGMIDGLTYEDSGKQAEGFFSRLFK